MTWMPWATAATSAPDAAADDVHTRTFCTTCHLDQLHDSATVRRSAAVSDRRGQLVATGGLPRRAQRNEVGAASTSSPRRRSEPASFRRRADAAGGCRGATSSSCSARRWRCAGRRACAEKPSEKIFPYSAQPERCAPAIPKYYRHRHASTGSPSACWPRATTVVRRRSKAIPTIRQARAPAGSSSRPTVLGVYDPIVRPGSAAGRRPPWRGVGARSTNACALRARTAAPDCDCCSSRPARRRCIA